jgi:hypothetical protein
MSSSSSRSSLLADQVAMPRGTAWSHGPEDRVTRSIRNISNHSPSDAASCPSSLTCSATSLWEPQISPIRARFQPAFSSQSLFKNIFNVILRCRIVVFSSLMCTAKAAEDTEAVNHSGRIFGVAVFIDCHKMSDVLQNS